MVRVSFSTRLSLTGKACAPSPDGRIYWEMTEEDIKKKKRCSDK